MCNLKIDSDGTPAVFCGPVQSSKTLYAQRMLSSLRSNMVTLCSCFSSHAVNKCPYHSLLSAVSSTFLWVTSLFKMAQESCCSAA